MCPEDTAARPETIARPDNSWVNYKAYLESIGDLEDASKVLNQCKAKVTTLKIRWGTN